MSRLPITRWAKRTEYEKARVRQLAFSGLSLLFNLSLCAAPPAVPKKMPFLVLVLNWI